MQKGKCSYGPLRGVGFGFIVAPIAFRMLKGEQFLHDGLSSNGNRDLLHFRITGWPVENIRQCPVANRWVIWIEQPGKRITI